MGDGANATQVGLYGKREVDVDGRAVGRDIVHIAILVR